MKTKAAKQTESWTKILRDLFLLSFLILFTSSCLENKFEDNEYPEEEKSITDLEIPEDFAWKTIKEINLSLEFLDNYDKKLAHVELDVYTKNPYADSELLIKNPDHKSYKILSGHSNLDGIYETKIALTVATDSIYICPKYIGVPSLIAIKVNSENLQHTIGGKQSSSQSAALSSNSVQFKSSGDLLNFGDWNSSGVPNYLEANRDVIDSELLEDINASLPEGKKLPDSHPQYLANNTEVNLVLVEDAEVWVTFVHEGAGWKNTLGYFHYPTNSPPASVAELNKIVMFPNFSYSGGGGGLHSGDKVQLKYYNAETQEYSATFPANTTVGWFLIGNAWSSGSIGDGNYTHYSISEFNVETDESLQQHNVLLYDEARELLLVGFEDIRRDNAGCDQDFNDAVYYTTVSPTTAVATNNVQIIDTPGDNDNDGVTNTFDAFPDDASKAYNNYYPSETGYGSLAFEDHWPHKGDYDFNDLVVNYNFNQITNGSNQVVAIEAKFKIMAIGAGFHNGFALELPVNHTKVSSVTGSSIEEDYISLNANGTEANQSNTVIIVSDDVYNVMKHPGTGLFINTSEGAPYVTPVELNINITFNTPVSVNELGVAPYNPFLIVNQTRGREVHLPNKPPTDLADTDLFATGDDQSNPGNDIYYASDRNLPWAMNIPVSFDYPFEKIPVIQAHLVFDDWAESNGFNYMDWYNNEFGYRNAGKIYSK